LNHRAKGAFKAYSAGIHPTGTVRPEALKQLQLAGIPASGFRSKSWDEFATPGSPQMNFVFTVCDDAANEVCPFWPGHPVTAHWGVPDPASVDGSPEEIERAFHDAFTILDRRICLFLSLPLSTLENLAMQRELANIGWQ
jgi:arsenate reductase